MEATAQQILVHPVVGGDLVDLAGVDRGSLAAEDDTAADAASAVPVFPVMV